MNASADKNLKARLRLAKSAEACCASLCGVFVALGCVTFAMRGFASPGGGSVIGALALAVFILTVLFGIYGRPAVMPKAVFALSVTVAVFLCPSRWSIPLQVLLYPLLLPLLIFGARWKGARFAALALTFMLACGMSSRTSLEAQGEKPPESLYLPASLATERPGGFIMVFGDSSADELLKNMAYRSGWVNVGFAELKTGLNLLRRENASYTVIIAGRSARFGGISLRKWVYRYLAGRLEPDGVLVMPADETALLPPGDWRFSVMPGGDGRWVAARRGVEPCVSPEVLDERIWEFSSSAEDQVLPRGAFSAMYRPVAPREVMPPQAGEAPRFTAPRWYWLAGVAAAWLILRLLLCRKARVGTAAAALETTAAMTLYSLAMFPKWGGVMMDTGITPFVLFAGIGMLLFPRLRSASRSKMRILTHAVIGLLPWVPGCSWCWLPLFCWFNWFLAGSAVFTGQRIENRRAALLGAVFGVAAGGALFWVLAPGANWLPVAAALLLLPSLLRR